MVKEFGIFIIGAGELFSFMSITTKDDLQTQYPLILGWCFHNITPDWLWY